MKKSGWLYMWNYQGKHSQKGRPDMEFIKHGIHVLIEIKSEKGKLSKDQIKFRNEYIDHGGQFYFLVHSLEELIYQIDFILGI